MPPETDQGPLPLRTRLLACLAIAAGFLLLYDLANWLAHQRNTTRCLAFAWELQIPRLTPFVVPYWSIDILLVAAPLATQLHQQLHTLLRRLAFALLLSCSIFLLWPCRCGFPRSIPDDWTAPLFSLLHTFDLPYNQAPSLHVSEAIIIAPVFLARLPQKWKPWAALWLASGCAATLLTHQHHLADLASGALTGWLALHLFPQKTADTA
jgi:membrane-associated phospholipid phosphatase